MKTSPYFILCLNLLLCLAVFGAAPTGSVTITGTAEVGQTLSAGNNLADADGLGAITYQWYRDGQPIKNTLKDGVGGVDGLDEAHGVTLSADGKHAYVAGGSDDSVSWYSRNVSTGALTYGGLLKDGVNGVDGLNYAYDVTLSADGNHAYVTGYVDSAVSWYERNASTGALTYGGMLKDGVGGVDGLNGARGVTLSADGKHAYVTGLSDDAVSWYERNASTGALTYGGMLKDGVGGVDGLDSARGVTLSSDGKYAYVVGKDDNAVSWYERNASTSALTYGGMLKDGVGGVDGLYGAHNVTLSSDGKYAYVVGKDDSAVSWYERNASTGALTYGGMLKDGVGGVDGLNGAQGITMSSDGNHAYVTGWGDSAVSWYERNASTGALNYGGMLKDGVGGVDGLNGAENVTLSADGKHAYVTGEEGDAVSWFDRNASTGALTYFNANQSTYTLTAADGDSVITVVASYTDGASNPESVSSAGTAQVQGAPSDIALDKIFVMENQPAGTIVGNLVVTDPNQNDSHVLVLVDDNGSALDKALFSIDANGTLRATASFDYENKWLFRFRVRATDPTGFSIERTLGVAVRNDISDDNHRLLAFGSNSGNSLGIGSQNVPLQIAPAGSGYVKVAAGQNHGSLFVKADGSLWGAGPRLGGEDPYRNFGPRQLDAGPVTSYSTGGYHSGNCALWTRSDGSLWAVGYSNYGKFGNGNGNQYTFNEPQQLLSSGILAVAAGTYHSVMIKDDGSLWTTGWNNSGQLGDGTTDDRNTWIKVVDANVTKIFATMHLSMFLKSDGTLWGMGENGGGQLGDGNTTDRLSPVQSNLSGVVDVGLISSATYALKSDGSLWKTNKNAVNGWELVVDANVTSIDGGGHRSNIVYTKTDGSLWCLGSNEHGEFGNGTYINSNDPIQVVDSNVVSAASGGGHTLFAKTAGSLWAMGSNSFGQFGTGASSNLTRPVEVLPDSVSTANPSGFGHILKNDGSLLHHGNAAALYLNTNQPTPTQYLNHNIVQAGNPYNRTVYLKADGSLRRLVGHGKTDEEIVESGVAVVAGPNGWPGGHTLFIKENGSLWGFGANQNGQLGDGTTTARDDPFQIVVSEVVTAAASGYHSLFIKTDGSLWAMGLNNYGQLGDGTTVDRYSPVKVLDDGVIAVAAGSGHTLFLKEDGSLWAMGWNHRGQLGDGTTQSSSIPVKVVDGDVIAMAAGYGSSGQVESLMVKTDGSLWSVGSNEYGQLGDGTLENRTTWTKVVDTGVHGVAASGNSVFVFVEPNAAPTEIALDKIFVMENQAAGTIVGNLVVTDPNLSDVHTYSFVDANGSALDKALFSIDANGTLRTTATFDYENKWLLRFRVRATDSTGFSIERTLGVSVRDHPGDQNHRLLAFGNNDNLQLGIGSQNVPLQVAPAGSGYVKVTARANHGSLFVKSDGSLWGAGQYLDGSDRFRDLGPRMLDAGPISSHSIGGYHSMNHALWTRPDGSLWAAGRSSHGLFGDGINQNYLWDPVQLESSGVTTVSSGVPHTLIVKSDGSLWVAGQNNKGQLGDGTTETRMNRIKVVDANVSAVFAATHHSLFLKTDGSLWAMGYNHSGQLGDGTTVDSLIPVQTTITDVASFSAQGNFSFVLKTDGSLWKTKSNAANGWEQVVDANVTAVDSGNSHTTFTKTDGSLWAMGNNTFGQLGDGTYVNRDDPVQVVGSGVVSAAAGQHHTVFAKSDGSLWAMGSNAYGQFGSGDTSNPKHPVEVLPNGVVAGNPTKFAYVLKSDGAMLYHGTTVSAAHPEEYLSGGVVQVANPYREFIYVKDDGSLWRQKALVQTEQLEAGGVASVASGTPSPYHALFIKEDGSLWAFGTNTYGQLGDGTTTDREDPVQVVDAEVAAVFAGAYYDDGCSFFIKTDGSLWAMGLNNYGQLGDGTTEDRHSPVKVLDDGVIAVTTGSKHTLFLKEDGSVWATGWNACGQLGDGTTQSSSIPVKVVDGGVIALTAGNSHSQIVKADGSLWSVGNNDYGQLGDGTLENRTTWTKVLDTGVRNVTASGASVFVFAEPNQAPTDLTLSNNPILENQPAGTIVGELNATDPDVFLGLQSFAYAFATGNGSQHNSLFSLDASGVLRTTAILDYENNATLSIRVKVTDDHNASLEKQFAIQVLNDPSDDPVPPGNDQSPGDGYQTPVYALIVSTHSFTENAGGSYVFGGQILTDGGSPVLEAGILISRKMDFGDPIRLPAGVDLQTQEFSITHNGLEPDITYYYRAYARNAVGEAQGVTRKLKTSEYTGPSPWWAGMPESAGGWRTSDWFGTFRLYGNGWIYHAKLGWAYAVSDGHQGIWLWQRERGWLWTQPGTFPYLWRHATAGWLYLLGSPGGIPVFWDFETMGTSVP